MSLRQGTGSQKGELCGQGASDCASVLWLMGRSLWEHSGAFPLEQAAERAETNARFKQTGGWDWVRRATPKQKHEIISVRGRQAFKPIDREFLQHVELLSKELSGRC